MNIIVSFIISLSLTGFYLLTINRFMRTFFYGKKNTTYRYILWSVYYLLQMFFAITDIFSLLPILLLNVVFVFGISIVSYQGSVKKHCFFSLMICTVWMLVEIIIGILLNVFGLQGDELQIAGNVISKLCMFIIAVTIDHYVRERSNQEVSIRYLAVILAVPIVSIYLMHHILLIAMKYEVYFSFAMIASVFLLLLNYVIFEVYDWMAQEAELIKKNQLYEQQLELCRRQAEEREAYDRGLRRVQHDIKSHFVALLGMLEVKDTESAVEYIRPLIDNSIGRSEMEISHSGNIVIDSLINYRYALAKKEGIDFSADIVIPSILPFESNHLAIVLGNLLENALEACREIDDGKRYIKVEVYYVKKNLMITVENTCKEKRSRNKEGRFLTTKKDVNNHGLGLSSVELAVRSYQGEMVAESEEGIFKVSVIMHDKNDIYSCKNDIHNM